MKITKIIKSAISSGLHAAASVARSVMGSHVSSSSLAKLFGMGSSTASGVDMDHNRALAIPAIMRSVSIISGAMLKVPFYVFKEDDESQTWDRKHEAWQVVNRKAHPDISAAQFRETMTAWALLYGNAVAYIDRAAVPGEITLVPLLPDRTTLYRITGDMARKTGIEEGTLYYQTAIDGVSYSFESSQVVHLRGLGLSPYWGVDVVTAMAEALGGAAAASEFGYRFWGQGANPAGWIEMPGGMDEPSEKRFIESVKRAVTGMDKAHKIAVLEEGSKFHPWTIDPEKAQFLEGKEFDIRILAMVIGIKVSKLIDSANSSYNSLEMSNQEHKEDDLMPWFRRWEIELAEKLLTEKQNKSGSHSIGVDDEQMEWVPFKDRSAGVVQLYNNGIITKDEARRRVNFGRSGSPDANRYRIPTNIMFEDDEKRLQKLTVNTTNEEPTDDPNDDPNDEHEADDQDRETHAVV